MNIHGLKEMPGFKMLMDEVLEKIKEHEEVLKSSDDEKKLFRAQGAVEALAWVTDLPDLIEAEKNLDEGL